jgi:hypothetical protein
MSEMDRSRRRFLALLPALPLVAAGWRLAPRALPCHEPHAGRREPGHPEPRPGVDASRVLPRIALADSPEVIPVFDMVRRMPRVADGLRCRCDCGDDPAIRSLLSCFEGTGMARRCVVCQEQARLAYRMHRQRRTLAEIRAAIDAEFC